MPAITARYRRKRRTALCPIQADFPFMVTVSIIIPAFNEAETIVPLLTAVRARRVENVQFEIVVIDDGSKDGTRDLIKQNPALYDKLVEHDKNQGKGAAVRSGLTCATGEWVLFQDADLEYDPVEYENLVDPVLRFDADVVIGSRFLSPRMTRVAYFWHKLGNLLITFTFNLLNNVTFTDIYSCYLMYRRTLVDPGELKTNGWEQQAEILSKVVSRSTRFYEVSISYHGRTYAEGKKIRAHHAAAVLWTIIKCRFFRQAKLTGAPA